MGKLKYAHFEGFRYASKVPQVLWAAEIDY
jgi:hypothetical protein